MQVFSILELLTAPGIPAAPVVQALRTPDGIQEGRTDRRSKCYTINIMLT